MYDIVFKNGIICDGTGEKSYISDIGIKDGKIAEISENINNGKEIIDIRGKVISPGFIDIHTHSDTSFLKDSKCESKIYQGVTTEVGGNCGSSIFPYMEEKEEEMKNYTKSSQYDSDYYTSKSFAEFMEKVKKNNIKMGTNLISLVGHGALRTGVIGQEDRELMDHELYEMGNLLEKDMEAGAFGMSLGLGYSPGINANQKELNSLGKIVAKYNGFIPSHMRNQGDTIYEALEEMYCISSTTGAKVHIAHLKLSGKNNWGNPEKLIENIRDARKKGIKVTADMYPYTAASSGITNSFPKWSIEGGTKMAAKHLQGKREKELMDYLDERFATKEDGEALYVVTTYGVFKEAEGKTIWELSNEWDMSMPQVIKEITIRTNSNTVCISFAMDEKDVLYLLSQDDITIGSDGSGLPIDPSKNLGKPHPRNFGTFPRFLKLARENKLSPVEKAVSRITGKNADIIGLKDRGYLKENYIGDITVFDPEIVGDNATFENPFMKNNGIEYVLINGEFALKEGEQTDKLLGDFILRK